MTPEELKQLQKDVEGIKAFIASLQSNATIPLPVGEAFRARLESKLASSTKTAASETQSVNEGGVSSYSVAKPMDGFLEDGEGHFIPYYT